MRKLLILIIAMMFLMPLASAVGEIKEFNPNKPTKGEISIVSNWGLPFISTKKADYTITSWTDQCLVDCSGEFLVNVYSTEKIFDSFRAVDKVNRAKNPNIKIFINDSEEYQETIYEEQCEEITENANGTLRTYNSCNNIQIGTETKSREVMRAYNYEPVQAGQYKVRIEGKKSAMESIDVIPTIQGLEATEWAWWSGSWTYKQAMNVTENGGTDLSNYQVQLIIQKDADMKADYSDLRFINASETGEFAYWIENYTSVNATVWIKFDTLTASTVNQFYMYYGNAGATSNSNGTTTFIQFGEFRQNGGTLPACWFNGSLSTYTLDMINGINLTTGGDAWDTGNGIFNNCTGSSQMPMRVIAIGATRWGANHAGMGLAGGVPTQAHIDQGTGVLNNIGSANNFQLTYFIGGTVTGGDSFATTSTAGVKYRMEMRLNSTTTQSMFVNGAGIGASARTQGTPYYLITGGYHTGKYSFQEIFTTNWTTTAQPSYVFGAEETGNGLSITLSSPANYLNSTSATHDLKCNATDETALVNVTLIINGVDNQTITTSAVSYNATFSKTFADGQYNWTCRASDSGASTTASTRSLTIDTTAPTVTIATPTANQIFNGGTGININFTASDSLLGVQSCWSSTNGGTTNSSIATCSNYTQTFAVGDWTVNIWANDSLNNIGGASRTFTVINTSTVETYSTPVLSGTTNVFSNTIDHSDSVTVVPMFYYNNTLYTSGITNVSKAYSYSATAPIVTGLTNVPFYWSYNFTFNGNTIQSTAGSKNQAVDLFALYSCNATYPTMTLNFTTKDEVTSAILNDTGFKGTFTYWLSSVGMSQNGTLSFDYLNDADGSFEFCIYPNYTTLNTNLESQYSGTGYSTRSYYLVNASISNTSSAINLFLFNSSADTDLVLKLYDSNLVTLKDYIVKMERYFPETNSFTQVEMARTDELGQAIFHVVEKEIFYKFIIQNGAEIVYTTEKLKVVCYDTPCVVELTIPEVGSDVFKYYNTVDGLSHSLTFNNNTKVFTFQFAETTGVGATMNLVVNHLNATGNPIICNTSVTGASGTLTCNVSSYSEGTFIANVYKIGSRYILDTLTAGLSVTYADFGLEGLFWTALLVMVLVCVGIYNPIVSIGMVVAGLIMISFFGIIALPWSVLVGIIILGGLFISQLKT